MYGGLFNYYKTITKECDSRRTTKYTRGIVAQRRFGWHEPLHSYIWASTCNSTSSEHPDWFKSHNNSWTWIFGGLWMNVFHTPPPAMMKVGRVSYETLASIWERMLLRISWTLSKARCYCQRVPRVRGYYTFSAISHFVPQTSSSASTIKKYNLLVLLTGDQFQIYPTSFYRNWYIRTEPNLTQYIPRRA